MGDERRVIEVQTVDALRRRCLYEVETDDPDMAELVVKKVVNSIDCCAGTMRPIRYWLVKREGP